MNSQRVHDLLDCEIDKIGSKTELNELALSNLYKLVDVKKDLLEIEEKERELHQPVNNYDGYSGRYDYRMDTNRYYPERNQYRNGYSMNGANDTYTHLEEAMRYAKSEDERDAIRQLMSKMYK